MFLVGTRCSTVLQKVHGLQKKQQQQTFKPNRWCLILTEKFMGIKNSGRKNNQNEKKKHENDASVEYSA